MAPHSEPPVPVPALSVVKGCLLWQNHSSQLCFAFAPLHVSLSVRLLPVHSLATVVQVELLCIPLLIHNLLLH